VVVVVVVAVAVVVVAAAAAFAVCVDFVTFVGIIFFCFEMWLSSCIYTAISQPAVLR